MFDFLRNIRKSAEEKRQERLNAYLDGALSMRERREFENELAQDDVLRQDLEQLQWIKRSVQQLPRVRAPRNFVLDPAVYGQKSPSAPAWSLYPSLRVATALTAFFLVLVLALDVVTPYGALPQPIAGVAAPQSVAEQTSDMADDAFMTAETEGAVEAPREVEDDGAAEIHPFAVTEEGEAALDAQEAAQEMVEEEAAAEETGPLTEEVEGEGEPVEETAADRLQEPQPEPTSAPGIAEPAAGLDEAAEATAASDTAALAPPEVTTQAEPAPLIVETQTPPAIAAVEADDAAQVEPAAFPYLLAIEIVLVVALAGLVIATVLMRRNI